MSTAVHVFMAGTSAGAMGFCLPRVGTDCSQPGRMVLDAAMALARAEPWLSVMETWLGHGLVPNLSSVTDPLLVRGMFTHHATLHERASGATVYLPLEVLRSLAPPPHALSVWAWAPLQCEVILDAVQLSESDRRDLRPGALVILPASFCATWQALLRPEGKRCSHHSASLHEANGRLLVTRDSALAHPPAGAIVSLVRPMAFSLHELMDWPLPAGALPEVHWVTDVSVRITEAASPTKGAAGAPARPMATGHLMPLGAGHAVRIDACDDSPYQSSPTPVALAAVP